MTSAPRYMRMEELVQESGISRFTLMPALRTGELHGVQRKKGGTWRVAEPCFHAWMAGDKCDHQKKRAA